MLKYRWIYLGLLIAILMSGCAKPIKLEQGKITLLRVHDVGTKYGPPADQIDVEVVIKLHSQPDMAFGFQLRDGPNLPTRKRMLDLLREAFNNNLIVAIEYIIVPGKKNGLIFRVSLPPPEALVVEVPNFKSVKEDPILKTGRLDASVIGDAPETPPEFEGGGSYDLMEKTEWHSFDKINLVGGESHNFTVSFDEPVMLLARVTWTGSLTPMQMFVKKDGITLATGKPHSIPPDRGAVIASVEINSGGTATVQIKNADTIPVKIEASIGTLALSFRE